MRNKLSHCSGLTEQAAQLVCSGKKSTIIKTNLNYFPSASVFALLYVEKSNITTINFSIRAILQSTTF